MNASRYAARTAHHALALLTASLFLPAAPLAAAAHRRFPSFVLAQVGITPLPSGGNTAPEAGLRAEGRTFLVRSIENGRAQAEIARLAATQATNSDVRELAQQLATDYSQFNTALEALARRKTVEVPLQPTSYSDDYRELARRSGEDFDHAFVHAIAAANARALRLCEDAVAKAQDSDVRQLAGSMLPVVRDHVNKTTAIERQ